MMCLISKPLKWRVNYFLKHSYYYLYHFSCFDSFTKFPKSRSMIYTVLTLTMHLWWAQIAFPLSIESLCRAPQMETFSSPVWQNPHLPESMIFNLHTVSLIISTVTNTYEVTRLLQRSHFGHRYANYTGV